jgi:DMSO/TMAO reductase YedYZ molybdopterin-dependent catalytic subunit
MPKFLLIFAFLTILLISITPAIAATTGTLEITDLSNVKYDFTYQQLSEMPKTNVYAELYCYGNMVTLGDWSGVQLSYLLEQINDSSNVNSIQFVASDSYKVAIPISTAMAPETIIAYQKDGVLLSEGLRLILPGYNGASWIAQIVSITLSTNEAATPQSTAGLGAQGNLIASFIGNKQNPPTITIPPKQQTQPTLQPTPNNSTPNPTTIPSNNTEIEPTPKQQTTDKQSTMFESGTIAIIAAASAVGLTTTGMMLHKRRSKLK